MSMTEHPFAPFIRTLGKGRHGSRALTQDEATTAMRMILAGEVEPMQLGAFLMLMRVKEESPEEVAGFVTAVRETFTLPAALPKVDLDWSSYAGKRRQLPWFLLAALLLASKGVRIFMHGTGGFMPDRVYAEESLRSLGIVSCTSLEDAAQQLEKTGFAYAPVHTFCKTLDDFIKLRPLLGLRSPVHTIARMLNPFNAPVVLQGIFHPGYRDIHQGAAALLNIPRMAVIKGEGGEIERNPDDACLVKMVADGQMTEEEWPALFPTRHLKDDAFDLARLKTVWQGKIADEYGEGAVVGTVAVALRALGRASNPEDAIRQAREMWQSRDAAYLPG